MFTNPKDVEARLLREFRRRNGLFDPGMCVDSSTIGTNGREV
jgi:hypothetical protein